MKLFTSVVLASFLALAPACKKAAEQAPAQGSSAAAGSAAPAGSAAATEPAKPAPSDGADFLALYTPHTPAKPADPVEVRFEKITVTKAAFDPKNLEGGTATIEIDLTSMATDSPKRLAHIKSPAYFDVAKFATATIDVSNVKKNTDSTYTADAKVSLHGVEKTYPVTFEVLETKDDSIKVRGEQVVERLDFKVGKEPGAEEQVGTSTTVRLQLTLKPTS